MLFENSILPELIGRFYSQTHQSSSNKYSGSNTHAATVTSPTASDDSNSEDYTKYCYYPRPHGQRVQNCVCVCVCVCVCMCYHKIAVNFNYLKI